MFLHSSICNENAFQSFLDIFYFEEIFYDVRFLCVQCTFLSEIIVHDNLITMTSGHFIVGMLPYHALSQIFT